MIISTVLLIAALAYSSLINDNVSAFDSIAKENNLTFFAVMNSSLNVTFTKDSCFPDRSRKSWERIIEMTKYCGGFISVELNAI